MSEQSPNLFNQVDQQRANYQPATVLVERENGDIATAQISSIYEGSATAYFGGDITGDVGGLDSTLVLSERLTDKYQEHLAEKLGGLALRTPEENAYDVLLTGTDEQLATHTAKQAAKAEEQRSQVDDAERLRRERASADARYNVARQSGASHEEAEASANRAYSR